MNTSLSVLWDHQRASYYEIAVRQFSGSSTAETVSTMGMPELLSAISIPLAVLRAKEY